MSILSEMSARIEDVVGLKEKVRRSFEEKFRESNYHRPRMEVGVFRQMEVADSASLEMKFSF